MIAFILNKYASVLGEEWIKGLIEIDSIDVVKDYDYMGVSSSTCFKRPNANKGDILFIPRYKNQEILCDNSSNVLTDNNNNALITLAMQGSDYVGIIKDITLSSGVYKISLSEMTSMFNESIFLRASNLKNIGIEDVLLNNINYYYKNIDGHGHGNEYITFSADTHTRYTADISTSNGIVNLTKLMAEFLKSNGVYLDWSVGANFIGCKIKKHSFEETIDLTHPTISDKTIVTTSEIVSRILVHFENTETHYDHDYSFILDTNGTIQIEPTENPPTTIVRAKGTTTAMNISAKSFEEMYAKVSEEFRKASYSNKITLKIIDNGIYTPQRFDAGKRVKILTEDGDVINSIVTKVSYSTNDKLFTIECGSLELTLTEKIRRIEGEK